MGASRGRVRLGQEPGRRHLGEVRVAIVEVPICQSELQRLGHRMDVLGRVVAHPLEVEALEDRECLEEDRPLAPEAGLADLEGALTRPEREASGHLDSTLIARQIHRRQQPAGFLDRPRDPLADVALVEQIAPRIDGGLAPEGEVALLFLRERAKRTGELGLPEYAADGGNRAFRTLEVDTGAARVAPHILELPGKSAREEFVPGETFLGQRDRRREDVRQ